MTSLCRMSCHANTRPDKDECLHIRMHTGTESLRSTRNSEQCTSYSLTPTTIPLAPPLVEVNGEVLKTLADRTVPFLHGWPIPVSPQEISPTLIVGYLPIGVGWVGTQNLPPFSRGLYPKRQRLSPSVSRHVCIQNTGTAAPTKTPSMFLLQNGNIASTHYRTRSLVTSTCTSYSLTPTTIPLAPPLVEVNGEVLKTLADRTVPFLHGWPIPVSPQEISPTLIVGYLPIGVGWVGTQNLPPFSRGLYPKRQRLSPSVSRHVCIQNTGTAAPTKTPSMFLLQNGNIASTHYRTRSLVTSTCTSYSLTPTTIPLAPPLVEVNGEVLKTLADRTVPFLHGWPIPVSPQEISPTLIVGYLPSAADWGYQGSSFRIFPAFLEGPNGAALRFLSSL